ncbi:KTSC domain-containing protein [Magnetovirga frankeli]|uniref:KTSC domain-containing protein n=1 Tax=Magnetovirga frankeli TaxID=947516 RepID=UPI0012934E05|nr:KTSC domain-containing protein [gamma proteobacterium SS-5]
MRQLAIIITFFLLISQASAEIIYVKYRSTPVDTSKGNFVCPSLKRSSFVNRICYDTSNQYLLVQLNSTYYHYCRMPESVVSSWISSNSLGRFYRNKVKGNYSCKYSGVPNY